MKLHQKIFGIGLLTAVIVPHFYEKGYNSDFSPTVSLFLPILTKVKFLS
jgi:hypothetical protein